MVNKKKEKELQSLRVQKGRAYPFVIRDAALRDYLGGMSRSSVAAKYSLPDPSVLSLWKRKFGDSKQFSSSIQMTKRRNKRIMVTDMESAQSQRIKELERALCHCKSELDRQSKELADSRLKAHIADTMIDLAEETYHISIRKNSGSK